MVVSPQQQAVSGQRPRAQRVAPVTAVDERLAPAHTRWWKKWVVAVGAVIVVSSGAGGVAGSVTTEAARPESYSTPQISGAVALQQWWLLARRDFIDLQKASDDVQRALSRDALVPACQHMHDAAEVTLQSDLPSPSAALTAEIHAAIEDFHAAAHMCFSVLAGSVHNYGGEFLSSMAEAKLHMRAAQDIIKKTPISV